ncbi:MAG: guanylate kinase [Cryomorphaceae bacterium]
MMKLLALSAPSGSGKTTLVKRLMAEFPQLAFSISATSRPPRGQEIQGQDYYFLRQEKFDQLREEKAFMEWEEVYPGIFYGSLASEVDRLTREGKTVVFDIDVAGGLRLKSKYPDQTLALFVQAPSLEVLEARLRLRGTDAEDKIQMRLAKATEEMATAPSFDHIIINDDLAQAYAQLRDLVQPFLSDKA